MNHPLSVNLKSGLLIALEGIDGSGTTTQAQRLADALTDHQQRVLLTCEPSKGQIGRLLRGLLRGETAANEATAALLFAADRLDHLHQEVEPALESGAIVITDRYVASSLAYQAVALEEAWVRQLNSKAPPAHLTIYLRVTAEVAAARRAGRGAPDERYDANEQQRRVVENYDRMLSDPHWLASESGWRRTAQPAGDRGDIAHVDGATTPDAIHERILALVTAFVAQLN